VKPELFVNSLEAHNFGPFMGVPCSYFTSLINYIDHKEIEHYRCNSEGEAMGLAGGFAISNKTPVVYMQNDGYGNTINPLSSLQLLYKLPALLLISWRSEPGTKDAPQHHLMGETIEALLDIFKLPYIVLDPNDASLIDSVKKAQQHCMEKQTPFALIIKKGYFDSFKINQSKLESTTRRIDYIKLLNQLTNHNDILLGSTGFSGRELYQASDHKGKFYMTGSMGYLSSIGLGIAKENPDKTIYVLDGDGSLLMNMGAFSTIGHYSPPNLIHVCFNNGVYESTGNQKTTANTTDFNPIAIACGYRSSIAVRSLAEFEKILPKLKQQKGPHFIHISISPGTIDNLERPSDSPETMKTNLSNFLRK
jgi:phosphonopyruvate decarboxylase